MKYIRFFLILLPIFGTHLVYAQEYTTGHIKVIEPWARALPAQNENGATYFTLENTGAVPDRLISAKTAMAENSQIHTHLMHDGVARMRQIASVDIPASESIAFAPGKKFHVMMMGLNKPLVAGLSFTMVLEFEEAGNVSVTVNVLRK